MLFAELTARLSRSTFLDRVLTGPQCVALVQEVTSAVNSRVSQPRPTWKSVLHAATPYLSVDLTFSPPHLPQCSLYSEGDGRVTAGRPTVIYYLNFDLLGIFAASASHGQMKTLWPELVAVTFYGHKHSRRQLGGHIVSI